jgi:hypothetical protein
MTATKLKPPIILIGNHRSGTSITQRLFALHPDIVTWNEPRTLWRCADPARDSDDAEESDATDEVVRYIRNRFLKYQSQNGDRRIMEKTPSNVLRVPFVCKVFPDSVLLHIIRNPFSYMDSIDREWHRTKKTWHGIRRSLADAPLTQLHYYAGDFIGHMVVRKLLRRQYLPIYGPRYKGIDQDVKEYGILRVAARQWARGNRKAREDFARLANGRVLTFRYEDLMQDPASVLRRIYDHCGLACNDNILQKSKEMVDPGRQQKWLRLNPEELKAVMPEIQDEMAVYGYEIPEPLR